MLFFVGIFDVTDEKNRIRIHKSSVRIQIRTKMSRIRNTAFNGTSGVPFNFLEGPKYNLEFTTPIYILSLFSRGNLTILH